MFKMYLYPKLNVNWVVTHELTYLLCLTAKKYDDSE